MPIPRRGEPIRVLYIAGDGRSGSTLLSRLLGQVDGWESLGELRYVWDRGMRQDRRCECGRSFSACPFWTSVVSRLVERGGGVDPQHCIAAEQRLLRTRNASQMLRLANRPATWAESETTYVGQVEALYAAAADQSGCSVVVDSSKLPAYGMLLRALPSIELSVVHLVRDPRASTHSWRRLKPLEDPKAGARHMRRQGIARSCAVWNSSNWLSERLLTRQGVASVRVRYEDLVAEPIETLERLTSELGFDVQLPRISQGEVTLSPGHAAAGNPDRHRAGRIALRTDDAWRTDFPARYRTAVTAATYPLCRRYGYV